MSPDFGSKRRDLLTLRDKFAMAALTGLLVERRWEFTDYLAAAAYTIADSMLEERDSDETN